MYVNRQQFHGSTLSGVLTVLTSLAMVGYSSYIFHQVFSRVNINVDNVVIDATNSLIDISYKDIIDKTNLTFQISLYTDSKNFDVCPNVTQNYTNRRGSYPLAAVFTSFEGTQETYEEIAYIKCPCTTVDRDFVAGTADLSINISSDSIIPILK